MAAPTNAGFAKNVKPSTHTDRRSGHSAKDILKKKHQGKKNSSAEPAPKTNAATPAATTTSDWCAPCQDYANYAARKKAQTYHSHAATATQAKAKLNLCPARPTVSASSGILEQTSGTRTGATAAYTRHAHLAAAAQ